MLLVSRLLSLGSVRFKTLPFILLFPRLTAGWVHEKKVYAGRLLSVGCYFPWVNLSPWWTLVQAGGQKIWELAGHRVISAFYIWAELVEAYRSLSAVPVYGSYASHTVHVTLTSCFLFLLKGGSPHLRNLSPFLPPPLTKHLFSGLLFGTACKHNDPLEFVFLCSGAQTKNIAP